MNYYNEHDPKPAAWLRELIRAGEIPPGDVDERDIQNVKPTELAGYTQCHFFAGVGGWSLALKLAGWPASRPVWTGSCPCQPFSQSGKGLCEDDERHLWPDFRNLIGVQKPTVVFGEQVASADGREWLAGVSANLEALAYRCGAADLCAAGIGSPNIRQRLYWVADSIIRGCAARSDAESIQEGGDSLSGKRGIADRLADADERANVPGVSRIVVASRADGIQKDIRMGKPDRSGWDAGQQGKPPVGHRYSALATGDIVRLGDTDEQGQQRWGEQLEECAYQWPPGTANLIVHCRDGKARRIESETFPLADGFPCRVGLLRGSGNAINPWLACEFISAWLDTSNEKS